MPSPEPPGACILKLPGAPVSPLFPLPEKHLLPRMLRVKECLRDGLGRDIAYLRLSVTARCNLASAYSPAPGSIEGRTSPMTRQEVLRLVRVFTSLGARKVRLTGGEPLLRRDLETIIAGLSPEVEGRVHLSTNGLLLARRARSLRDAGLAGVNLRLDAADRESFRRLSGRDGLSRALAGLDAARAVGLETKLNAMVVRGANEDQILPLARLAQREGVQIRFIEYMPRPGSTLPQGAYAQPQVAHAQAQVANAWHGDRFMAAAEIFQILQEGLGLALEPEPSLGPEEGPARLFRVPGSTAKVGIIATFSTPVCDRCHRVRLSSRGQLKACIFGSEPVDLLGPLRHHATHEELVRLVRQALTQKLDCPTLPLGQPGLPWGPRRVGG